MQEPTTCLLVWLRMTCTIFNAVIACSTESSLCHGWEQREESLTYVAKLVKKTFSQIGTNAKGQNASDVTMILCESNV